MLAGPDALHMLDPLFIVIVIKNRCNTKKQHFDPSHQVTPHEFRWAWRQGTKALPDGPMLLERESRKIPEKESEDEDDWRYVHQLLVA